MLQVIGTCLQHLVLAMPQLCVQLLDQHHASGREHATEAPGSTHSINASVTTPAWLTDASRFEVVSGNGACQLHGHVAPFGTSAAPFQHLSVNGWPVQQSVVHDLIQRVHTSLHAGMRRRPTSFSTASEPSYALHMRVPSAALAWSGPPLQRSVEFADAAIAEGLAACALHRFWRQHMPAVVLSVTEDKMRCALAERPCDSECVSRLRVPAATPPAPQRRGPGDRKRLLHHAVTLLQAGVTSEADVVVSPPEAVPEAPNDAPAATPRQAAQKVCLSNIVVLCDVHGAVLCACHSTLRSD